MLGGLRKPLEKRGASRYDTMILIQAQMRKLMINFGPRIFYCEFTCDLKAIPRMPFADI